MTTALRITSGIFLALAGVLYRYHQDLLALIFTGIAIILALSSLFTHRKETKKPKKSSGLEVSNLHHPDLREYDHKKCVLWCSMVNKSGQMVTINKVLAFDSKDRSLPITWSNAINPLGAPLNVSGLIGIKDADTASLYLRHNHGTDLFFCKLEIYHSLSDKPITKTFDDTKWE